MNNSLKGLIQSLNTGNSEVIQGIVISENPVKIQGINDPKLIIYSPIIPFELSDFTIKIQIAEQDLQDVTVKNSLKTSEKVYLLSFNNKKQYFVLGRVDYIGNKHL